MAANPKANQIQLHQEARQLFHLAAGWQSPTKFSFVFISVVGLWHFFN
jgi:hypothetical protein